MEAPMIRERIRERTRKADERLETERYLAIAVAHNGTVVQSNGHKRESFEELVDVLLQSEEIPATLCFYTEGVHWVTRGSPLLGELQEIRRRGAEILACRACLTEAGLLDSFVVGRLDTQDHIDDILRHAQHTMVV